ncbi:MAG: DNA helicase, partial [Prevotella salivae]|nr:DNA helicase [Segatella salivae]
IRRAEENKTKLLEAAHIKAELLRDCKDGVLAQNGEALYNEWRAIKAKWFLPRFFAKRTFIKKLKQFNSLIIEQEVDALLSNLLNYQLLHKEITTIQDAVRTVFAVNLDGENLPSDDALKRYTSSLDNWLKHIDRARDWYQWCAYKKELENEGLGVIAHYIEQVEISADQLKDAFFKRIFRNIASEKIASSPILRTFEGAIFDETISRYQQLTEEFQLLSQKELYARLASNIPHVTESIDNSSPIGFLNRNIANGGRGISLRDLFDNITTLLPRLCPCMLMSPMSVAQFLTLSQSKFDLVIFDEASQMPTSEAVGAIARGKSVIVVGDPKQMPPTSFFSSTSVGEDEADIDDLDSILDDCHSLGIPSLQLNWHYRSKHESLIAFSNNEYYDGELITFPSIDDQTTKVKYCYVDGVYDKGGRRSNRMEAETIVEDIVKRLQSSNHAKYSIGVIAFSQVQQNLIEDLLADKLDKDKKLREAADELYEPIFIKNLENVQGDERDIILFSIGYGPDKDGKVSMNFGPLNNNGGEKRLNVAVSRARREMIVYSSLKASQIDLRRTKARGVEGLKHFLEYAEQQILIQT